MATSMAEYTLATMLTYTMATCAKLRYPVSYAQRKESRRDRAMFGHASETFATIEFNTKKLDSYAKQYPSAAAESLGRRVLEERARRLVGSDH